MPANSFTGTVAQVVGPMRPFVEADVVYDLVEVLDCAEWIPECTDISGYHGPGRAILTTGERPV
ncbi:MAG TPA: hypothetical protein PK954_04855 [Anaerolineales bacterium]|nr:hypothetical protein [Anaerolineales bacterium]HRF48822.1 hypothetical protein [Anaerolineales bacterium]